MDTALLINAVAQAASSDDDGLTWREILADLPHDPASIAVLLFVIASVALVIWAGRPGRSGKRGGGTVSGEPGDSAANAPTASSAAPRGRHD